MTSSWRTSPSCARRWRREERGVAPLVPRFLASACYSAAGFAVRSDSRSRFARPVRTTPAPLSGSFRGTNSSAESLELHGICAFAGSLQPRALLVAAGGFAALQLVPSSLRPPPEPLPADVGLPRVASQPSCARSGSPRRRQPRRDQASRAGGVGWGCPDGAASCFSPQPRSRTAARAAAKNPAPAGHPHPTPGPARRSPVPAPPPPPPEALLRRPNPLPRLAATRRRVHGVRSACASYSPTPFWPHHVNTSWF